MGEWVGATPWGELLAEVDAPPVWSVQVSVVRGSMWLYARAWRTLRMDVLLSGRAKDAEAAAQIWEGLVPELVAALDWTRDVRVTTSDVTERDGRGGADFRRKCIIQVKEGEQLEPVINLLARFKERWESW